MLIPYNTDAPIYHWPYATVGLIVVNTYVFMACVMTSMGYEREAREKTPTAEEILFEGDYDILHQVDPWERTLDPWILHYGEFRPWEWVTSNFIHGDFLHLLGNMAVLWGLGLIVEGKVGWWRFLLIFFAIGIGECALEQTLTLWMSDGGSFGASAIVFGLVAIAVIWAPRNDVSCILFFGYVWAIEVSVLLYAGVVLALEVVLMLFSSLGGGFAITSAVLHLAGALIGAIIGVAMVKLEWVDCEGFDLFAVIAGREGQQRRRQLEEQEQITPEMVAQRKKMALDQIRHLIAEGQPQLAHAAHQRMRRDQGDWHFPAGDYLKLIAAYQKQKLWVESIPLMVHYLKHYDQRTAQVRLQLAKILIEQEDRPIQAERVMAKINSNDLDASLRKIRDDLLRKAQQLRAEGSIEAAAEDW